MTTRRLPLWMLALTATTLILGPASCSEQDAPAQGRGVQSAAQQAVSVALAAVQHRPVERSIKLTGELAADEVANISAKVPGRIVFIAADMGDRVEPGALLARIAPIDYELDRDRRAMGLQEVLARLGLADFPGAEFDAANVPTVRRAALQAQNEEARFRRVKQLWDRQPPAVSQQEYTDQETAWQVAQSDHEVALLQARALLAEAATRRSELRIAEQLLADTTVTAPAPGEGAAALRSSYGVAERLVSSGEYMREGTPMFRLLADDPIRFRARVPERFASDVRRGGRVEVQVEAHATPFTGTVTRINPQIDPSNRTFMIEAVVPNGQGLLRAGAFARGRMVTGIDPEVLFVPQEAVTVFAGSKKVFTVHDGKAVEHAVETGELADGWVEITRGLPAQVQQVVIDGAAKLARDVPVEVQPAPAPGQTATPASSAPKAGDHAAAAMS